MEEVAEQVKGFDEKFCISCGKIIKNETVICPHCGVQIKDLNISAPPANYSKDKTVAILLASFLFINAIWNSYSKSLRARRPLRIPLAPTILA